MRIHCAKCNKRVTSIKMYQQDLEIKIAAFCHGEVDVMSFPVQWPLEDPEFYNAIVSGATIGTAFVDKKDQQNEPA